MEIPNDNLNRIEQAPPAENSALFGTSSSDIVEGLHNNAYSTAAASVNPGDDEQIVNEQDQQEIVNLPEEEIKMPGSSAEIIPAQNVPGIEKDLFDKNILEEKEVPEDEDDNDVRAV